MDISAAMTPIQKRRMSNHPSDRWPARHTPDEAPREAHASNDTIIHMYICTNLLEV
jgi:hypothetical protein